MLQLLKLNRHVPILLPPDMALQRILAAKFARRLRPQDHRCRHRSYPRALPSRQRRLNGSSGRLHRNSGKGQGDHRSHPAW